MTDRRHALTTIRPAGPGYPIPFSPSGLSAQDAAARAVALECDGWINMNRLRELAGDRVGKPFTLGIRNQYLTTVAFCVPVGDGLVFSEHGGSSMVHTESFVGSVVTALNRMPSLILTTMLTIDDRPPEREYYMAMTVETLRHDRGRSEVSINGHDPMMVKFHGVDPGWPTVLLDDAVEMMIGAKDSLQEQIYLDSLEHDL